MSQSYLKTRDYERLLSYPQLKKYSCAIRRGYFNNYHGIEWRHSFWGAFIWKYPKRVSVLERFERLLGRKPEWDDITDDYLRDLKDVLIEELSPNSVRVIGAELCALIRENKPTKNISSDLFSKVMKAKSVPVQAVYLTREEIEVIDKYNPPTKFMREVKRLFMIECLTGARKSDSENLSIHNTYFEGKHRVLKYVSQKTKTEVIVPVDRRLPKYLIQEEGSPKDIQTHSYNRSLRSICRKCGIISRVKVFSAGQEKRGEKWQFVSSHTGRRSFATNLSLNGVSIEQISLMMGHMNGNVPDIQMTQRYIMGKLKLDSSVFAMFGAYTYHEENGDVEEIEENKEIEENEEKD